MNLFVQDILWKAAVILFLWKVTFLRSFLLDKSIVYHNRLNDQNLYSNPIGERPQSSSSPTIKAQAINQTGNNTIVVAIANRNKRRIPILQYHNDWVCVNKPPGMTVHRSKSTPKHQRVLTKSVKKQLARKVFPIHRLDHRTSGAMLFAFDSETAGNLHTAAIRNGKKLYIALLRGIWKYPSNIRIVDEALKVQNNITKDARTKFTLLASSENSEAVQGFRDSSCCLVLCEPLTGRTHQIRRHARFIGHPLIGDTQHGNSRVNRCWREKYNLNRLFLHCWKIEFDLNDQSHCCIAPLSTELRDSIEKYLPSMWKTATNLEPQIAMLPYDNTKGTFGRYYKKRKDTWMQIV